MKNVICWVLCIGFQVLWGQTSLNEQREANGQSVNSHLDTLPSGELILRQEIVIHAPLTRVWKAYTDTSDWKKWVTPVVEMDFRTNGYIKTHYNAQSKIGDEGTIVIHILNYIPMHQITMQAEIGSYFPAFLRNEEKNLYSIVEFNEINENSTQVVLYGIGYKNQPQWRELLNFFIKGNEMTLNKLKKFTEN